MYKSCGSTHELSSEWLEEKVMAALRSVLLLCVLLAATIIMFIIGAVGKQVP